MSKLKTKIALIILSLALIGAVFGLVACSDTPNPYEQRRAEGFAAVRFNANGGTFMPSANFIAWVMPGSIIPQPRQNMATPAGGTTTIGHASLPALTRGGYWATWHLPVRDADNYIVYVDPYTPLLQETPWDFAVDVVPAGATDLVLFANWHREFVFRFIEGTPSLSVEVEVETEVEGEYTTETQIVAWQYDTRAFDYNLLYFQDSLTNLRAFFRSGTRRSTHSLLSVYATQEDYDAGIRMTDEQIASLHHPLDYNQPYYVTLFTRWIEGDFVFVSTAADLPGLGNSNIFLEDNISLADVANIEAATVFGGLFAGRFYGNGFRVSDITLTQTQVGTNFGLFTQISGTIRDVEFYNVTININFSEHSENPPRIRNIGFFAGQLLFGAVIQDVSILNSNFNIDIPPPPYGEPQMRISDDYLEIGFYNPNTTVNFTTVQITKYIANWWIPDIIE